MCVNNQRLECRYFVPTREISVWPTAADFWSKHGISSELAAQEQADASSGVHYSSFGGKNQLIAHSVILGAFDNLFERSYLWGSLHSFAVSTEQLAAANELLSDGGDNRELDEEDARTEAEHAAAGHAAIMGGMQV